MRGLSADNEIRLLIHGPSGHAEHVLSLDEGMELSDDLDDELAEHGLRPALSLEEAAEVVKQSKEAPEPSDAPEVIPAGTAPGDRLQVGMVLQTSIGPRRVTSADPGEVVMVGPHEFLFPHEARLRPLAEPFVVPKPAPKPPRVYVPAGWIPGANLRVGMVVNDHDGKHRVTDVGDDFACLDGTVRFRSLVSRLPLAAPYFGPE